MIMLFRIIKYKTFYTISNILCIITIHGWLFMMVNYQMSWKKGSNC